MGILVLPIIITVGVITLAAYYRERLFESGDAELGRRWLFKWMVMGLVLPLLVWMALNLGRRPVFPPLSLVPPPTGTGWLDHLVFQLEYVSAQTAPALFVVATFWGALTLGWYVVAMNRRTDQRQEQLVSTAIWCVLLLPLVAAMIYRFGPGMIGLAALFCVWPLAHYAISLKPVVRPPVYARAIARMKQGKYREAERAIIGELEKCETDFDGWLMLAALYARQFGDLSEAERTIYEICDDPGAIPPQIAVAFNQLADWQLQIGNDPAAARHSLDEIIRRLPGSHLAKMATLRLNRLPATAADWKHAQEAKTIRLPVSHELEKNAAHGFAKLDDHEALALANKYSQKLQTDPNDVEAREQLAVILAERLGEVDLAIEQLESLIAMPGQASTKIPEWLALMASWEIKRETNPDAIRKLLLRIIREYPQSSQAFPAQQRLSLLDAETRAARARTAATDPVPAKSI
jgi:tetratricopeptide (TPR) repeat protein